jgi:hypothetical protein
MTFTDALLYTSMDIAIEVNIGMTAGSVFLFHKSAGRNRNIITNNFLKICQSSFL